MSRGVKVILVVVGAGIALFVLAMALSSCAHDRVDALRQTVANAESIEAASIAAFEEYDQAEQTRIVNRAIASGALDAGRADLAHYRQRQLKVAAAIAAVTAVTAAGASMIPMLEHGQKTQADVDRWLEELVRQGIALKNALDDLGVHIPGVELLGHDKGTK